ncbi:MAG: putative toxin-antitoxin system toxin component, PIN family [Acidobacteria bacterium]|nr:putative toxin-antitoxin system toxin component, PIN family [Acidobacteriota bacterium]
MRVFFDTNVLVSAVISRGISAELFELVLADHQFITGEVNLTELRRILLQRFRAEADSVRQLEKLLRQETIIPKPDQANEIVRDPDDTWVLASAVAAGADILVTGDKDLLQVSAPLPTLTPRDCWLRLRGSVDPSALNTP